jgi:hypothetical protein
MTHDTPPQVDPDADGKLHSVLDEEAFAASFAALGT